jgi:hypothetical protein
MNKKSVERIVLSILILLIVVLLTLVIALLDGKIKIPANQRPNGRGQSLSLTINMISPDILGALSDDRERCYMWKVNGDDVFQYNYSIRKQPHYKSPVSRRTRDVVHIYALDVDEIGLSIAPCRKFSPAFLPPQTPLPFTAAMSFEAATLPERITHYTLLRKVVCQKGHCPLWIPPQEKAICPPLRGAYRLFLLSALRALLHRQGKRELWCGIFNYVNLPFPIWIRPYRLRTAFRPAPSASWISLCACLI